MLIAIIIFMIEERIIYLDICVNNDEIVSLCHLENDALFKEAHG